MFCLWQGEAFRYPRESWKSCLKEIIYSGKNQTVKQILFQMLFSGREWIDMYRLFDEEIFWESEGEENCYSQQKKWNSKSEFCFRGSLEKKQVDVNHLLEEKKKNLWGKERLEIKVRFFCKKLVRQNFDCVEEKDNLWVIFQDKRFIRLYLAEKLNFDKIWLQQRKSFEAAWAFKLKFFHDLLALFADLLKSLLERYFYSAVWTNLVITFLKV